MSKKRIEKIDASISKKKVSKPIMIISIVFIALFLVVVYKYCFGCFKIPIISQYKDDSKLSNDFVSVNIKENTLSKIGATIILTNNSDYEISYGYGASSLEIEHYMFNSWFMMLPKRNISTLAMGKIVKPKESVEITYDWKDKYGRLSSGRYRMVIDLMLSDENDSSITEKYRGSFVSYEFKI